MPIRTLLLLWLCAPLLGACNDLLDIHEPADEVQDADAGAFE